MSFLEQINSGSVITMVLAWIAWLVFHCMMFVLWICIGRF